MIMVTASFLKRILKKLCILDGLVRTAGVTEGKLRSVDVV